MISRKRSVGFASLASLLVAGVVGLPAAHAQDSAPPAGYPPPGPAGYPAAGATDPNAPPPAMAPTDPNAPPGAYPAPPPGAPPPTVAQPAPLPRNPWLAMPFIGIHSIQNSNSGTGPGLRIGGIGGFRASDQLSLNGEVVYDVVNLNNSVPGDSFYNVQVAAAPFYHVQASPTFEVLVGPKVGFFRFGENVDAYGGTIDRGINGLVLGANVGGFVRLSNMVALGGMLNFDFEKPLSCSVSSPYYTYGTSCDASAIDSEKLISATVGALF